MSTTTFEDDMRKIWTSMDSAIRPLSGTIAWSFQSATCVLTFKDNTKLTFALSYHPNTGLECKFIHSDAMYMSDLVRRADAILIRVAANANTLVDAFEESLENTLRSTVMKVNPEMFHKPWFLSLTPLFS